MKVFVDLHHAGLAHSLKLLFEDRFHDELYFPIGVEWFEKGYWNIADPYKPNHMGTVKQFLDLKSEYIPRDGTAPLLTDSVDQGTHYEVADRAEGYTRKHITWGQFQDMDIDIIIGSIPAHWRSYTQLRDIYKPHAKVICHAGNEFYELEDMITEGIVRNGLFSIAPFTPPVPIKTCFYLQEFPLDIFKPAYTNNKKITSFVNCFSSMKMFENDYELFRYAERDMPEWEFRAYGASCRDGVKVGLFAIASEMGDSRFIWHTKRGGDGYGHILFNVAAMGKPLITRMGDYRSKLGERLLIPNGTCIAIDDIPPREIVRAIIAADQEDVYNRMVENMKIKFQHTVNFAVEAVKVRRFIESLF